MFKAACNLYVTLHLLKGNMSMFGLTVQLTKQFG